MKIRFLVLYITMVVAALLQSVALAQTTATAPAGQCRVIMIEGLPASTLYERRYQDWIKRFHAYLTSKAGVPAANIVVLSGGKNFKDKIVTGPANVDTVLKAIDAAAKSVNPQDQFVLILIGHGSLSDEKPGFVLQGIDLEPETLAKALAGIRAENQVVLNFSGSSGDFLEALVKPGRVNIAATSQGESAEPVYAEFFLRGLETGLADGEGAKSAGTKDGAISLLEAYNRAAHQTALWICRQIGQEDGSWLLHGKESVEIFKKLYDGPEGPITPGGMRADGSRKLSPISDSSKPDEMMPISVPPEITPGEAAAWEGRRVVNEHAQLEDIGEENGISALRGPSGYEPIAADDPTEQGSHAARVVLGKSQLLPPPAK